MTNDSRPEPSHNGTVPGKRAAPSDPPGAPSGLERRRRWIACGGFSAGCGARRGAARSGGNGSASSSRAGSSSRACARRSSTGRRRSHGTTRTEAMGPSDRARTRQVAHRRSVPGSIMRRGRHALPIERPIDGPQQRTQLSNRHGWVHRHLTEHAVMLDAQRAPFAFTARRADFLLETLANPHAVTKLGRLLIEADVRGEERRSLVKAHQGTPGETAVRSTGATTCQRLHKLTAAHCISRRDSHTGRPRGPSRSRCRSCGDHKVNGPRADAMAVGCSCDPPSAYPSSWPNRVRSCTMLSSWVAGSARARNIGTKGTSNGSGILVISPPKVAWTTPAANASGGR
jgi:hypothetical protein